MDTPTQHNITIYIKVAQSRSEVNAHAPLSAKAAARDQSRHPRRTVRCSSTRGSSIWCSSIWCSSTLTHHKNGGPTETCPGQSVPCALTPRLLHSRQLMRNGRGTTGLCTAPSAWSIRQHTSARSVQLNIYKWYTPAYSLRGTIGLGAPPTDPSPHGC